MILQAQRRNCLLHSTTSCNCSKPIELAVVLTVQQLFIDKIKMFNKPIVWNYGYVTTASDLDEVINYKICCCNLLKLSLARLFLERIDFFCIMLLK